MVDGIQLAKIFGPVFIILGLWELFSTQNAIAYTKAARENAIFPVLGGLLNLIIGFTILTYFNEWDWNFGILVTLLGWCAVIKGIALFFFPKYINKFKINKKTLRLSGVFVFLWGFGLCYWGYLL